jgi:hypothetical protein
MLLLEVVKIFLTAVAMSLALAHGLEFSRQEALEQREVYRGPAYLLSRFHNWRSQRTTLGNRNVSVGASRAAGKPVVLVGTCLISGNGSYAVRILEGVEHSSAEAIAVTHPVNRHWLAGGA